MTDVHRFRMIAEDLLAGLDISALGGDEQFRSLIEEQRGVLRRALDESTIPERYKVAVVGSFKVGKSSFVNALCDQRVLTPVDAHPETASITILQYSDTPSAEAHFIREEEWMEMKRVFEANPEDIQAVRYRRIKELAAKDGSGFDLEGLERKLVSPEGVIQGFACEDWESKEQRKAFNAQIRQYVSRNDPLHYFVDHLVIRAPVPILKDGIDLIDTPGLDDTDRYHVLLTEEYVQDVDAILFLTRSGDAYSQSDKDFIVRQLRRKTIKHLRLVITKCNETFASAVNDALARDEEPPTFECHLQREEERVRAELNRTLDEILAERDVDETSRTYFREQLSRIHMNFISSTYYFNEHRSHSGIDRLRDGLSLMLQKSERGEKARRRLIEAINQVSDRTSQMLKTRIGSVSENFSARRVRQQLETISDQVHRTLSDFERKIEKEIETFGRENEKDEECVAEKIDGILQRCNEVVARYARQDVAKSWQKRRYGRWGSLYQIQQQVADAIFPHVELLLQRQVKRFEDAIRRMQDHIGPLQQTLASLEEETHLDGGLEPLALSESFRSAGKSFVVQVKKLVKEQRDCMVQHLDSFVSEDVRDKIEQARSRVSYIFGKGTTQRQISEVEDFYSELESSLRESMDSHLRGQVEQFGHNLLNQAQSLYPEIERKMRRLIDDRLNAIGSNLSELNEAQKAEMLKALHQGVCCCEKAREKLRVLERPERSRKPWTLSWTHCLNSST
ncbi:MAG: dynamin family protein [Isosphaeraceae bacterium]|nr:dynamin family protein [Isosphaeraceae bacterium]